MASMLANKWACLLSGLVVPLEGAVLVEGEVEVEGEVALVAQEAQQVYAVTATAVRRVGIRRRRRRGRRRRGRRRRRRVARIWKLCKFLWLTLQSAAKKWAKGCVIPRPGLL